MVEAPGREGMLLWRFGSNLRRDPGLVRQSGWTPETLRKHGVSPATVIDVGAAGGTHSLYAAFPGAHHVLIEPQREFEPALERIVRRRKGEYILTAVGDHDGTLELRIDAERPWMSSALDERGRDTRAFESRTVPLRTLDGLREEHGWSAPFGVKIDAEGYESNVIAGARRLLGETQFVIAEISVIRRFEETVSFADFIALMDDCDFALYDILDAQKTAADGPILFLDAFFSRKTEFLA
jgi:FkbM family methyltransferase